MVDSQETEKKEANPVQADVSHEEMQGLIKDLVTDFGPNIKLPSWYCWTWILIDILQIGLTVWAWSLGWSMSAIWLQGFVVRFVFEFLEIALPMTPMPKWISDNPSLGCMVVPVVFLWPLGITMNMVVSALHLRKNYGWDALPPGQDGDG